MTVGQYTFADEGKLYVMGILNATPDSFSDGGKNYSVGDALLCARRMVNDGVDIIDVGGESTRPGFDCVSCEEEISRVVPVIEAIRRESDIPISIDTRKSIVARKALEAGANLVNDVSGLFFDEEMGGLIAETKCPCCLMHDGKYFEKRDGNDYIDGVICDIENIIKKAVGYGILRENIVLDPGVGFGKTPEENLLVLKNLEKFKVFGLPVLLGCSRKSVIGAVTGAPVNERLDGTLVTTAAAVKAGLSYIRVHDVKENVRFMKMWNAVFD